MNIHVQRLDVFIEWSLLAVQQMKPTHTQQDSLFFSLLIFPWLSSIKPYHLKKDWCEHFLAWTINNLTSAVSPSVLSMAPTEVQKTEEDECGYS